jgi:hypothetical protein
MATQNSNGQTSRQWMAALGRRVQQEYGVKLHQLVDVLPDMFYADAFEAGVDPDDFFDDAIYALVATLGWHAEDALWVRP